MPTIKSWLFKLDGMKCAGTMLWYPHHAFRKVLLLILRLDFALAIHTMSTIKQLVFWIPQIVPMLFLKSFMKFWYIVHIVLHTPQLLTMKEAKKGPNTLYKTTTWRWVVYWYTTQYTKALPFLSGCLPNRNWVSKNWTWRKTCGMFLSVQVWQHIKHHSKAEKR
jgi:hypothetical protein